MEVKEKIAKWFTISINQLLCLKTKQNKETKYTQASKEEFNQIFKEQITPTWFKKSAEEKQGLRTASEESKKRYQWM